MAFGLEPAARVHAMEIAVNVQLEVDRWVISGSTDVERFDHLEAQLLQIEAIDERIDDANRIVLVDPVIEASRQQRQLLSIRFLDEPRHPDPRRFSWRI